ncbi:MAG: hypothetical protein AAGA54_11245 [Myxococcota bacterium]
MRFLVCSALLLLPLSGCGEDEEERNAPPVGSAGSAGSSAAASSATAGGSSSGGGGGSSSGGANTFGTSGSTGPGDFTVLSGRFLDGNGGYALPIRCRVLFHSPGQVNPSTGISTANLFSGTFVVDAFPQSFVISSDDIGGLVEMGETGFVTTECDIDGNNFFDDDAGGYFPSLPLVEVTVPASSLDLAIGPLQ